MDYKPEQYHEAIIRLNKQVNSVKKKLEKSEQTVALLQMAIETMDKTNDVLNKLILERKPKINDLVTDVSKSMNAQVDALIEQTKKDDSVYWKNKMSFIKSYYSKKQSKLMPKEEE